MNLIKTFKFTLIGLILGAGISALVAQKTTPIYQSLSEVLILRTKLETPYKVQEESRNRWIWLRDGLSLQQNILDEKWAKNLMSEELMKSDNSVGVLSLREKVSINYTGADEFLFIIKTTDHSKDRALLINQHVFERLQELYLEEPVQVFEKSLSAFSAAHSAVSKDANFQSKITELSALHAWEQAQREASFQVLLRPTVLEAPIWPKKTAILVVGLLAGLFLGLGLDYLSLNCKNRAGW